MCIYIYITYIFIFILFIYRYIHTLYIYLYYLYIYVSLSKTGETKSLVWDLLQRLEVDRWKTSTRPLSRPSDSPELLRALVWSKHEMCLKKVEFLHRWTSWWHDSSESGLIYGYESKTLVPQLFHRTGCKFPMLGMIFILTHTDLKFGTCHSLAVKSWFQVARTLWHQTCPCSHTRECSHASA